jgi:hypothetical protein
MSDPTTPSDPAKPTASPESGAETAPPAPAPAVPAPTSPATTAGAEKTDPTTDRPGATDDVPAAEGAAAAPERKDNPSGDGEKKVRFWRRGPFVTVAGAVVVLVVLGLLGYVWGLGPLNRLNTNRGITPPAKLAGLDRITDADIRGQLQLDQTKQALSRINNGKQATVEAYGNLDGDRLFVVIALRGKVDIAKTVADSGAAPDKVKKIGQATCVETTGNLPTQCYRGSNTLTVIAQSANEGITVDQVAPVAVEAFHAMK